METFGIRKKSVICNGTLKKRCLLPHCHCKTSLKSLSTVGRLKKICLDSEHSLVDMAL